MPNQHAEFSPSKAHRFLACTASHDLEKNLPDSYSDSAREGSRAHALAEKCLRENIRPEMLRGYEIEERHDSPDDPDWVDYVFHDHNVAGAFPIPNDMIDAVSVYVEYVLGKALDYSVENKIDILPNDLCYGTADCIFLRGTTLYVVDYKHGAGHYVSAVENKQMMCYAFGKLKEIPREVRRAKLVIVQPRCRREQKIEEWIVSREDLLKFGIELSNTVQDIKKGKTKFEIGPHCKFCKAEGVCPEKRKVYLADFQNKDTLDLSEILNKADEIREWLKATEQSAIEKLTRGEIVTGYKLVAKQARGKIGDEKKALADLVKLGYDVAEHKIKGLTALRKIVPDDILSPYVVKESSGFKLAKESETGDALAKDFLE